MEAATRMNSETSMDHHLGFSVSVEPGPEGGTVVTIIGELDLAAAPALREAFDRVLDDGSEQALEVDMRACSFVDSSGIATLVGAARRLHDEGGLITIRGAQERVRRTFDLAGLATNHWVVMEP
jgi:anti-anti-sigma factor